MIDRQKPEAPHERGGFIDIQKIFDCLACGFGG
jgi:hypothetical protein